MSGAEQWSCSREQDVLDAIASMRWPARCDQELRDHVEACRSCGDLVEVACAFANAPAVFGEAASLPPASLVWWRAQLRAREEAARAASRPVRLVQQVALAVGVLLAVIVLTGFVPEAISGAATIAARVTDAIPSVPRFDTVAARDAAQAALANRGVQLAAAAWLVLGPVAIYLAVSRD